MRLPLPGTCSQHSVAVGLAWAWLKVAGHWTEKGMSDSIEFKSQQVGNYLPAHGEKQKELKMGLWASLSPFT